ncbi:MAG: DPP IV N-terminal domain-containing protein, partial [Calditrichaceae bacterium]
MRIYLNYILFIILIDGVLLFAGDKRAITFEDFFAMQRLGDVVVSPDAKSIAYTLAIPNVEEDKIITNIWILNLSNLKASRFTEGDKSSSAPAWSPDSKYIYYNYDGQIWKKAVASGEAVQVTDFAPGAAGIVLNSDGSQFLFTANVYPDCPDEDCNKLKMDEVENSKVKARVIDHLMYRHWNQWKEGKRSHVFMADADGKNVVDLTPGDYDAPPVSLGSSNDYTFSPDGKEVCFVRNMDEIVAASTNNDL